MESIIEFFTQYGLIITIIAIIGIVILGILKYCNVFKKLNEKTRHYCYLIISVGFSIISTAIYLAIIGKFTIGYISIISSAIYALNQTFYNIFKITPINELVTKITTTIIGIVQKNNVKKDNK